MCWNADISINTFIFGTMTLLFIYWANTYTKYKSPTFNSPFVYLYLMELVTMQLVEYFIWKNMGNKKWNELFSKIGSFVGTIQPLTLMMLITKTGIRNAIIILYFVYLVVFFVYKGLYNPIVFKSYPSKNGHLSWEWGIFKGYENINVFIFFLFYVAALYLIPNKGLSTLVFISLVISLFYYFKDNTYGSMWCWITNVFLLYFIVDILIKKPFIEYNGLC